MSKLLVLNESEGVRVPFLRGILVRSLQSVGLDFEAAYEIATSVRHDLRGRTEVTSREIRERVLRHLDDYESDVVSRYGNPFVAHEPIVVRYDQTHTAHYSRGRQRLGLLCAALTADDATAVATRIHAQFIEDGITEVGHAELRRITYEHVRDMVGAKAAKRYLTWQAFRQSGRPLIVLVGGATGTGKSTVAAQLSHVLDIVRTQSTDMLREAMRMMIPKRLMPVLHESTFEAWKVLPVQVWATEEDRVAAGYLAQTELISVSCAAVVQRALTEGLSMILEGVHVHASMLSHISNDSHAIIVPVMLSVLKPKDLKRRIQGRGRDVSDRRAERYLSNFDAIWSLQTYLLGEADTAGIALIENDDVDTAVRDVTLALLRELKGAFDTSTESVLG